MKRKPENKYLGEEQICGKREQGEENAPQVAREKGKQ